MFSGRKNAPPRLDLRTLLARNLIFATHGVCAPCGRELQMLHPPYINPVGSEEKLPVGGLEAFLHVLLDSTDRLFVLLQRIRAPTMSFIR